MLQFRGKEQCRTKMTKVCPRTGRSPLRRKKTYLYGALVCGVLVLVLQMTQYEEGWMPLRPLSDIRQESKRLLTFLNHFHYTCNYTLPVNNHTHWPLCLHQDGMFDLDSWDPKLAYSIGFSYDDTVSRDLATNHSFNVYLISHKAPPANLVHYNNTNIVHSTIVPNDPADFSRNLYGQQTLNDLMASLKHERVSLLRLGNFAPHINTWEVLQYAIQDRILVGVQQLHVVLKIDKLDDDVLYNWYRVLWQLFYEAGLLLYHTTASDSLCMQVTVMESCIYYLSFIRNPGLRSAISHPPADYGTWKEEEVRLISHLTQPQTDCSPQVKIGASDERLQFSEPIHPQWKICATTEHDIFTPPCTVFRFRSNYDPVLEQQFLQHGCAVTSFQLLSLQENPLMGYQYKMYKKPPANVKSQKDTVHQEEQALSLLWEAPSVALLEIDMPGHEWAFLSHLLDGALLRNVSQLVLYTELPDGQRVSPKERGTHAGVLRLYYSEMWRLQAQGMQLYSSSPVSSIAATPNKARQDCCYRLSFVRKHDLLTR